MSLADLASVGTSLPAIASGMLLQTQGAYGLDVCECGKRKWMQYTLCATCALRAQLEGRVVKAHAWEQRVEG